MAKYTAACSIRLILSQFLKEFHVNIWGSKEGFQDGAANFSLLMNSGQKQQTKDKYDLPEFSSTADPLW